jgi:hypothetical protein
MTLNKQYKSSYETESLRMDKKLWLRHGGINVLLAEIEIFA